MPAHSWVLRPRSSTAVFFGEDDPRATYCVFSQGHKVPVSRTATLRFVLAHRRNDDAVAGENSAQDYRLKEQRQPDAGIMHAPRLRTLAGALSLGRILQTYKYILALARNR